MFATGQPRCRHPIWQITFRQGHDLNIFWCQHDEKEWEKISLSFMRLHNLDLWNRMVVVSCQERKSRAVLKDSNDSERKDHEIGTTSADRSIRVLNGK